MSANHTQCNSEYPGQQSFMTWRNPSGRSYEALLNQILRARLSTLLPLPSLVCFPRNQKKKKRKRLKKETSQNHGGSSHGVALSIRPWRTRSIGSTMGCDGDAVLVEGRKRHKSRLRIRREFAASMRELLRVLQHILWVGAMGVDLLPLRNTEWPLFSGHCQILASSVMRRDDLLFHRSRVAL